MNKQTLSFCPTCYKVIPATIYEDDGKIWMEKCCAVHGETKALVEPSAEYYAQCMIANAPIIYPAYNIEITSRCNQQCKFCYHPPDAFKDPTQEEIIQEAWTYKQLAPIVFIGGEPCLRHDLVELVQKVQQLGVPVELVTNGTRYPDEMLDKLLPMICNGKTARINLSMHKESDGKDLDLIKRMRSRGLKLESILFVVENEAQVDQAIRFSLKNADVVEAVRIKAATCIWNEQKPEQYLFTSELIKITESRFDCKPIWWRPNKVSFFNTQIGPLAVMLVTWYNTKNVDLNDIKCPPLLKAYNGQIENVVTADLINEGIDRGWLNGMRIERITGATDG